MSVCAGPVVSTHTRARAMRYERRMDVRRSRLSTLNEPRKVHPKRPRIQLVRFVFTAPLYYNEKKIEGYMNAKKRAGKNKMMLSRS